MTPASLARSVAGALLAVALTPCVAHAGEGDDPAVAPPLPVIVAQATAAPSGDGDATKTQPWMDCTKLWRWFDTQCAGFRTAWYEGRPTLYLTGYTWHDPSTYSQEKLDEFNQQAWGGGYGWTSIAGNGDRYSWYAMAFKDSHADPSVMAGFAWMTYWPEHSEAAVGLGYTAFLMSRSDIAHYVPFPAIAPLASVRLSRLELMGSFIPKLNAGINHGNVAFLFTRFQF